MSRSSRGALGAAACLVCIGLLVSSIVGCQGAKAMPPLAAMTKARYRSLRSNSRQRHTAHLNLDPLYSSKRRVPNGPDPIHNRRAGKSVRPPGRA